MITASSLERELFHSDGQHLSAPRFHESLEARLRRWALSTAYALQPKRIHLMPRVALLTAIHFVEPNESTAELLENPTFHHPEGLVGVSDDLSVESMLSAYKRGIFPISHLGPMKWWSPADRAVLFFKNSHIEKGVRKQIRQKRFDVTFDQDFAAVMQACAEPRAGKTPLTWLRPRVMQALWDLHKAGYAHSVEVWDCEPQLVGGIFGIAIGEIFFGESQFSSVRDASKIASAYLNCHLANWGFVLRDGKWLSSHLAGLGFTTIPRNEFEVLLSEHASRPGRIGTWEVDEMLDVAHWERRDSSDWPLSSRDSQRLFSAQAGWGRMSAVGAGTAVLLNRDLVCSQVNCGRGFSP